MAKKRKKKKLKIKWSRVIISLAFVMILGFGIYKGATYILDQIISFFNPQAEIINNNDDEGIVLPPKDYKATVIVDPGHGGVDAGTNRDGVLEKNITLSVAKKIKQELYKKDIEVILTREDDSTLYPNNKIKDLNARAGFSEKYNAKAFVSIHVNAFEDTNDISGFDFYTRNEESESLMQEVSDQIDKLGLSKVRSVQDGHGLQVLRDNTVPAILVEMGYINGVDFKYLSDEEQMDKIAVGIAKGIESYINELE